MSGGTGLSYLEKARTQLSRRRDLSRKTLKEGEDALVRMKGLSIGLGSSMKEGEEWSVREQVVLAALDSDKPDADKVAEREVRMLEDQFPDSTRVKRLRAMLEEHKGNWPRASKMYDEMLKENKGNSWVRKRKACLLKARGQYDDAIACLVDYLKEMQADTAAWMELVKLYVATRRYACALFCCEEVLLAQPEHHAANQLCAELLFTLSGTDNLRSARKYFSQSLLMKKEGNARALWGISTTCSARLPKEATRKIATTKSWRRLPAKSCWLHTAPRAPRRE